MLQNNINNFLSYCENSGFTPKSIESLSTRLNEFNSYIVDTNIKSIRKVTYKHLLDFIVEFNSPSIHIKKARIWALHQFFHNLKLNNIVIENIAMKIPYPKIEKTVPEFLTANEFKKLLKYFHKNATDLLGLRNLIVVMMFGFLGLRTSCLLSLNTKDIDVFHGFVMVKEKGGKRRSVILPTVLCEVIVKYLHHIKIREGPFFVTKHSKRISERTLQDIFSKAIKKLKIDKHLHARLFRHTAATHLNQVSDLEVTKEAMGHASLTSTYIYVHINPDKYVSYMKFHPYKRKRRL